MNIARRYFISCASVEFRSYREELRRHLTNAAAEAKVQEDFTAGAATLLEKLDDYIGNASAVLHLIGNWAGSRAQPAEVRAILNRHPDFAEALPELQAELAPGTCPFTYTQWECYLAIYHRIPCFVYIADDASRREPGWVEDPQERAAQDAHRERIRSLGHDRTTLPFADARDVALSFYRAFESQVAGATFAQATFEPLRIKWPEAPPPQPYRLADREKEFRMFLGLLAEQSSERLLLLHGPTDRGKSSLLAVFEQQARALPPVVCGRADFKNGPSLRDVLDNLSQDLRAIRFVRFERELRRPVEEPLRRAFLQDLSESRNPVVLLLDDYEEATDEAQRWVEQSLFSLARRFDGLRIVVAGQKVPALEASALWASVAHSHELPPITDPVSWCRYLREVLGVTGIPDEHVVTMVKAARGSPRPLSTLLAGLQPTS